jgi:hypothetical protein
MYNNMYVIYIFYCIYIAFFFSGQRLGGDDYKDDQRESAKDFIVLIT